MRGALALFTFLASLSATAQLPMPTVGDRWTYRLTDRDRRDAVDYVVTVGAVSRNEILDQVAVGGGRSVATRHTAGAQLFGQAGGVFSPYLPLLDRRPLAVALRDLGIADAACTGSVVCEASASVAGQEQVEVPAGKFTATRIVIEQSWRPAFSGSGASSGARVITVWYAPEMQRAIKYSSRLSFGDAPPMEANFDLELASFRVAPPPARVVAPARPPKAGDNWAYRITETKRPQARRSVFVRVASVTPALIVEQVSVEGGFTAPWRHAKGGYLIVQGVSVFAPYLPVFDSLVLGGDVGYIESNEPGCRGAFVCTAKGKVVGEETVEVAAGRFKAVKVEVEQTWRPAAGTAGDAKDLERMRGGRTLTVWYASDVKRAVKYESRRSSGERPPFETDFDCELTAYQAK
jgi:hypothetical protein